MKSLNRFATLAAAGALAALATAASAQMVNNPGPTAWTPSGDITVHRSVELTNGSRKNSSASEGQRSSGNEARARSEKQQVIRPAAEKASAAVGS